MLNLEIDIVDFLRLSAEAPVKGFQEVNVVKALGNRLGIVAGTWNGAGEDLNAGRWQGVVG